MSGLSGPKSSLNRFKIIACGAEHAAFAGHLCFDDVAFPVPLV
jgi:hypothetical protein